MNSDREAFEKLIRENRYDHDLHHVYGDWLEEHGFDDEAKYHHTWTKERQEAEDWLRDFACKCGQTCENYNEHCDLYFQLLRQAEKQTKGEIDLWAISAEVKAREPKRWVPVTYEMVIQAGHDMADAGPTSWGGFVQMGSEDARDLMYENDNRKKFWKYFELVTGRKVDPETKKDNPFSCSC